MKYTHKDICLNYEIFGEGETVLSIHGLGCDMSLMKGCIEPVFSNRKNYRRVYLDLPGMGASTSSVSLASSDDILEALIDFICHVIVGDFILIGESYGGYLSLGLLLKLPCKIKKVLLVCPMVEPDRMKRNLPYKDTVIFDNDFLKTLDKEERDSFCEYAVVANSKTYQRYVKEVSSGFKLVDITFLEKLSKKYKYSFSLKKELNISPPQVPVLILAGKQDICVGYKDLFKFADVLPRSSFVLLDYAGHNLQIDQESQFNSIVLNWVLA